MADQCWIKFTFPAPTLTYTHRGGSRAEGGRIDPFLQRERDTQRDRETERERELSAGLS